jgi:hypothetical protein
MPTHLVAPDMEPGEEDQAPGGHRQAGPPAHSQQVTELQVDADISNSGHTVQLTAGVRQYVLYHPA